MRRSLPALYAITIALLLALTGCGSGGSTTAAPSAGSTPATAGTTPTAKAAARQDAKAAKAAEAEAPKGASPTLRAIYRSFPPPRKGSLEPPARKALAAGEAACRGKTPLQVKEEFYAEAEKYLEPEQKQTISRIGTYEEHAATDPSFVAGQLAADVYAATLEEEEAQAGYRGCVHALAQGLERRLAPKSKKE